MSLVYLSVTPFCFQALIIFTIIIIPNCFSGRLPMSPYFVWFDEFFLSYSFTCWIFLCLFMLLVCCVWGLHSSVWRIKVPLNFGVCSLWVELGQCLVMASWLGEPVSVCVLVHGTWSHFCGGHCSVQQWVLGFQWVWYGFGVSMGLIWLFLIF